MIRKQPLDQTNGIAANTINHTAKVLKKSKLEGSILEKLYEFSRLFHLRSLGSYSKYHYFTQVSDLEFKQFEHTL